MSEMWKIVRKMTNHIQCNDCDLLVSAYRGISTACQEKGVNLAIGLGLNLPGVAGYGHRCPSFADLKNVLHDLKQESKPLRAIKSISSFVIKKDKSHAAIYN